MSLHSPPENPLLSASPRLLERLVNGLNPTLVVALVALSLLFWQWSETKARLTALQLEVGHRLATVQGNQQWNRNQLGKLERDQQTAHARLALLENKFAETQSQQAALTLLYQDLSQHRDRLLFAEIEQMLQAADLQLNIALYPRGALIALEAAQNRLAQLTDPKFIPLRQQLNADIGRLKALPEVDATTLTQRLDALTALVDGLRLKASAATQRKTLVPRFQEEPTASWLSQLASELQSSVMQLIQVRRIDRLESALITPEQQFFVRENLRLHLLCARLAILQRDQSSFRGDLQAAQRIISSYFDPETSEKQYIFTLLQQLMRSEISLVLPTLTATLSSIQRLKAAENHRTGLKNYLKAREPKREKSDTSAPAERERTPA